MRSAPPGGTSPTVLARGDPPEPPACAPRPPVVHRRQCWPGGDPPEPPACAPRPAVVHRRHTGARRATRARLAGRLQPSRRNLRWWPSGLGRRTSARVVRRAVMPSGPFTRRSASSGGTSDSGAALTTLTPGMPSARRARTAANAARSPRSSPQNMTDRAARSAASSRRATPLSMPGGRSSMTWRPGSTVSPDRSARASNGPRSRASAASGSAVPRVCTASACPLSSVRVPSGAPAAFSTPGRSRRTAATPGGAAAARTRPSSQRSQP